MNEKETRIPADDAGLPENTYYVGDLVGLRAVDEADELVGTVVNVLMTKQQCLEIAAGLTPEELAELEEERRKAKAGADAAMKEYERIIKEKPGAVPNVEKALRSKRRKLDAAIPKAKTFLVPFVNAYVGDVEPDRGLIHLRNATDLMEL